MEKIGLSLIFIFLIWNLGCEKNAQPQINTFSLTQIKKISLIMERRLSIRPCFSYKLSVDFVGMVFAERNCSREIEPSKCNNYESNGISKEKRSCFKDEIEKLEKKLNSDEIEALKKEIEKSKFFSFEDDYSQNSKNCLPPPTDLSTTIITVKSKEKEKTITHYKGCFVKQAFSEEDALQSLTDLENKIDEIVGTKKWIEGK